MAVKINIKLTLCEPGNLKDYADILHDTLPILDKVADLVEVDIKDCCEGCGERLNIECNCGDDVSIMPQIYPVIIRADSDTGEDDDWDEDEDSEVVQNMVDPWEEELSMRKTRDFELIG